MSEFAAMRAGLVERGLIEAEYRLTPAGDDYARAIIAELRDAPPPPEPEGRVRWNSRMWKTREARCGQG